jgi:hypothetical protein
MTDKNSADAQVSAEAIVISSEVMRVAMDALRHMGQDATVSLARKIHALVATARREERERCQAVSRPIAGAFASPRMMALAIQVYGADDAQATGSDIEAFYAAAAIRSLPESEAR